MRKDVDTPISWVNVTCNGLDVAVSRKYIFDEDTDTESDPDERFFNKNPDESDFEEDYIPYPHLEIPEDTLWWDDQFNHEW
jgi:hypothetical protein